MIHPDINMMIAHDIHRDRLRRSEQNRLVGPDQRSRRRASTWWLQVRHVDHRSVRLQPC